MFQYLKPKNICEAIKFLGDTRFPILAGGTDLLVQWHASPERPSGIIDIGLLEELATIIETDDFLQLGALTTHMMIMESNIVDRNCPALVAACNSVGAVQIQNRGTVGGNIVTASPAADIPPVLMAFDAQLEFVSLSGTRVIPIRDFYIAYRKTAMNPDEMLTRIIIKKNNQNVDSKFFKVGTRRAQSISKASLCVRSILNGSVVDDISIALGSVAPTVVMAPETENLLKGKKLEPQIIDEARRTVSDEIKPIDDIRSTADYRKFVAGNLLRRYLLDVAESNK